MTDLERKKQASPGFDKELLRFLAVAHLATKNVQLVM